MSVDFGHYHDALGPCPHCLAEVNCFAWRGGDEVRAPSPGDFSHCALCGQFCVVDDDRRLRKPTAEEQAWVDDHEPAQNVVREWRLTRQRRHRAWS